MVQEKVLKWLQSTGFPLEMAAANAFRRAGFEIRQSTVYTDSETGKGREIDIIAADQDWIGTVNISCVLECKASTKPWVVLTSDDAWAAFNRLSMFAVMSDLAKECLATRIAERAIQSHIQRPARGGYGLRQALADGGDAAYTASCNAMKASMSIARAESQLASPSASFAFPIIVVDTQIFECSLLSNGELDLREVQESEFLFSMRVPESITTCIKIVTKDSLPAFALKAKRSADQLRSDLKNEEQAILKSLL
ncbi:hypothetical protein [Rhodoferax sp. TS-BS-61-7]|uniref:hypothetical protein n=1 Tax=Rhodoferax sp. TS-BS-61-7 TaxID=2094194 RepID=UPI000D4AFA27|nr:hypothetical protein [Rhodoferax sp. TS-BS-61-7]PQA78271.1 hypothetical protein C5F53_08070 [Rhodoferax sp. TS-BS-61-7]